jgi:hypothetical protein
MPTESIRLLIEKIEKEIAKRGAGDVKPQPLSAYELRIIDLGARRICDELDRLSPDG